MDSGLELAENLLTKKLPGKSIGSPVLPSLETKVARAILDQSPELRDWPSFSRSTFVGYRELFQSNVIYRVCVHGESSTVTLIGRCIVHVTHPFLIFESCRLLESLWGFGDEASFRKVPEATTSVADSKKDPFFVPSLIDETVPFLVLFVYGGIAEHKPASYVRRRSKIKETYWEFAGTIEGLLDENRAQ